MEICTSFQWHGGSTAVISNRQSRTVAYVAPREAWLLAERRPVAFRQSAKPAVAAAVLIEDKGLSGPAAGRPSTREDCCYGVVPYWSSHLDGAQSELIVRSGHGVFSNPDAVLETIRILHLEQSSSVSR